MRTSREAAAPATRTPSSVLSTAELTGLLQEGTQEAEGAVSHEGIVLHDAPLLSRHSASLQPHQGGRTCTVRGAPLLVIQWHHFHVE